MIATTLRPLAVGAALAFGMIGGLAAGGDERTECRASCKEVELDCETMCKKHKMSDPANCRSVCKQGAQACIEDCDAPDRE